MSEYNNLSNKFDGILLGYPFDQLLDQECGLLKNRYPGIKLSKRKTWQMDTKKQLKPLKKLAKILLNWPSANTKHNVPSLYDDEKKQVSEALQAAENIDKDSGEATEKLYSVLSTIIDNQARKFKGEKKKLDDIKNKTNNIVTDIRMEILPQVSTGNIVICGEPGTAKSTLALQFAAACVHYNWSVPAYISLETSPEAVREKVKPFGWEKLIREIRHIHEVDDFSSADRLAKLFKKALTQPDNCPVVSNPKGNIKNICKKCCGVPFLKPCILMPSLSPRPVESSPSGESLFATRFHQMERLLEAGARLNEAMRKESSEKCSVRHFLPLVVIDSLNMFGQNTLNREEIYRLFALFRRCGTTGVFVVETTQGTPFDSTMADVVISMKMEEDQDYTLRYMEIEKSRYYHQVYGRHVFRTSSLPPYDQQVPIVPSYDSLHHKEKPPKHGVVVFPSLHYLVLKTEKESPLEESKKDETSKYDFGIKAFERILPANLNRGQVVMLVGPRGTFKTTLALNFLAKGFDLEESVLLIRFSDVGRFQSDGECKLQHLPRLSKDMAPEYFENQDKKPKEPLIWETLRNVTLKDNRPEDIEAYDYNDHLWRNLVPASKIDINVWASTKHEKLKFKPRLFEIAFKGGFLMPEEFVHIVREILIRRKDNERIRRIVLDDISQIGVSYPVLRHSRTTGDFFLAAFVHLMRNDRVDLVMTGTTGELAIANDAVSRGSALADTVVSCKSMDVFGGQYVVIGGEGLIAGKGAESRSASESVPAVVHLVDKDKHEFFNVNDEFLEGLIGLDSGKVHRPGVTMHLFQENNLTHGEYNRRVELMVRSALACEGHTESVHEKQSSENAVPLLDSTTGNVMIRGFSSDESDVIHHSLEVLGAGAPLDRTVLYTVDEFWETNDKLKERLIRLAPEDVAPDLAKIEGEKHAVHDQFATQRHNEKFGKEAQPVWPYYLNVLLLAYRRELKLGENEKKSWETLLNILKSQKQIVKSEKELPISRLFWFDMSASETLSCALMDTLLSGWQKKNKRRLERNEINDIFDKQTQLGDETKKEICALNQLFQKNDFINMPDKEQKMYQKLLVPDAGVYLCWYSQLQELIAREPGLATKLEVCSLPGYGFTGDWYIGIAHGSVSTELGVTIIRMLCSKEEEYKRSAKVGLPVRKSWYINKKAKFYAWPRGSQVLAEQILNIHQEAYSRADITRYDKIRSTLSTLAEQLTPSVGSPRTTDEQAIKIIKRVFAQVKTLRA
jgi:KaiC/GvpD/RAD55 family RecA-like ATPase